MRNVVLLVAHLGEAPAVALDGHEDPLTSAPSTKKGRQRTPFKQGRPAATMDKAVERSVVNAYKVACGGRTADIVLCDPDLNALYTAACREASVPGDPATWNHLLLRVRKAGKLPGAQTSGSRLAAATMDPYSAATEVAVSASISTPVLPETFTSALIVMVQASKSGAKLIVTEEISNA